jgi:hypothetical protein
MFDHKDIQFFVGILACCASIILFSLLFWAVAAIRKRVDALTAEPPAPKPEPKEWRVRVETKMGTTDARGTTLRYPPSGQLHVIVDDALTAVFAPGHWLQAQVLRLEKETADTNEPKFNCPGYWTHNSPRLIEADINTGLVYATMFDSPDGLIYAESLDLVTWTRKRASEMSVAPNPPNQV